ncbi:MAG: hypothetical protein CL843_01185 [Crocinitomicaceae bacterium]|nr:hypothetical protein [Crocinitomicaceae bacterium]|tara:strand:- start:3286 stop:4419 length:1134 start_codon:yes stop_codon:yes gene_type:complete
MNPIQFIFTADDYGPIPFVNEGILHHVRQGSINSVQVLPNMETDELEESLFHLWQAVPVGKTLDLGVHLTLTSGRPLYKREEGEAEVKKAWKQMVEKGYDGHYYFRAYTRFYVKYMHPSNEGERESYQKAISSEFELQKTALLNAVARVNALQGEERLVVTSVSNHQNILTTSHDLFNRYTDVVTVDLAIRSPKMAPKSSGSLYYGAVLPVLGRNDYREYNRTMRKLYRHFSKNSYYDGEEGVTLKTPSFIDVRFYNSLGSVAKGNVSPRKIRGRKLKFRNMVEHAYHVYERAEADPDHPTPLTVETVFHLGKLTTPFTSYSALSMKKYPGVTHKYFDNRLVEFHALDQVRKEGRFDEVFNQLVSWKNCSSIVYKKE